MKIELEALAKFFTPRPAVKKTFSHKIRKDEQQNYWTPRDAKAPAASRITLEFNGKKYRGNYRFDDGRLTVICGEVTAHLDAVEDHVEMRAREVLYKLARSGELERFAEADAVRAQDKYESNAQPTGRDMLRESTMQKIDLHNLIPADAVMVVLQCSASQRARVYRTQADPRPYEIVGNDVRLAIELEEPQTLYVDGPGTHAFEVMGYGRA